MEPYYTYRKYLKKTYGSVLHRIPIDMGFSCPNRNKDKSGGCSFCPTDGARASQTKNVDTIDEQIKEAIKFSGKRYNADNFIAYIQAFSATFDKQSQNKYINIIKNKDFKAISFGTRPDCLNQQAYDFLYNLNKQIDVWVELGVQTTNEKTLTNINRGHTWQQSKQAILELKKQGIKIAAHVIIGLPGEANSDYIKTARELSDLPIDAIKIHNLLILKNTQLEQQFTETPFRVLYEKEYAEKLILFLQNTRNNIPIMRITTDAPEKDVVEPKWHMIKENFINYVTSTMINQELFQGDALSKNKIKKDIYSPIKNDDESITFFNEKIKEHYHAAIGAQTESKEKFIIPAQIEKYNKPQILDICFGLGYNSLCAIEQAIINNKEINITALEYDKRVVNSASKHIKINDIFSWSNALNDVYNQNSFSYNNCTINMLWGDARHTIEKLPENNFDIIFLDAFSTQKNSELWTVDFFKQIKKVIKQNGILITYCAAIPVRAGLIEAGFYIGETKAIGRPRGGTIASLEKKKIHDSLPDNEHQLLKTTKGIPYRDPYSVWNNKEILRNRHEKVIKFKQLQSKKNIT